jgi:hypothetical protein
VERHLLVHEPIAGLVDGVTYYTRNVSGDTFQLATTPGGAPITSLDGTDRAGTHSFARAGLDLVGQSGTHSLRLDLTSAPGANHLLLGPNGVSLRTLAPPPGDGQSSASAKGGGGGFVASGDPDGVLILNQHVQAFIAPALMDVGGNVTVHSVSDGNVSAYGSNGGGGFVAVGNSDAETHVQHSNRAYVGVDDGSGNIVASGVNVKAGGHISITTDSSMDSSSTSNADGGGFVASVDADSVGEMTTPRKR